MWITRDYGGELHMNDIRQLWTKCSELLQNELPEGTWKTWIEPARLVSFESDTFTLVVPNVLVKDRIETKFLKLIEKTVNGITGVDSKVCIEIQAQEKLAPNGAASSLPVADSLELIDIISQSVPFSADKAAIEEEEINQNSSKETLSSPGTKVRPPAGQSQAGNDTDSNSTRYTFDAFVIGSSNRFAHAASLSVAEKPAKAYNPLFIHGEAGLGKTHLLHAIGNYVKENYPTYKVTYVSTETFMNEFVDAIRRNTTGDFKRRYRQCDVLLVDDIQFLEGKESLQEEFFHTFNSLNDSQKQIVITSDRPPKAIATLENRLKSRFLSGLITDIQPPDLETRLAILRKMAFGEGVTMKDEVLEFIANHVTDNIRELEGAFIRASAFTSLSGTPLDRTLAEQVLSDIVSSNQGRAVTPAVILDITAKTFGFSIEELCSASRRRPLTTARQIAMYLCRELTDYSYPAIGNEFGGRDHTTVIHAVSKVSAMMAQRKQIYDQVSSLIHQIKSSG